MTHRPRIPSLPEQMTGTATVVSVSPDGRTAIVETARKSACEGCHKGGDGCAACSLLGPDRKISCRAENAAGALPGDRVMIESSSSRMILYAAVIFILPVLAGLAAYLTASAFGASAVLRGAAAAAAFLLVFAGAAFWSSAVSRRRPDVFVSAVLSRPGESPEEENGTANPNDPSGGF